MYEPSYLDPFGNKLPALERNLLKLRSLEMVLVLFYAEQLKTKVLSLIRCTDDLMDRDGRRKRVPVGAKRPVAKCLDALEADGALTVDEKTEIQRLLAYRNSIGHDIHELVADITTDRYVRRSMKYLREKTARYDYEAVARLQHFLKLLSERARTHNYISTISFDGIHFQSAERVFLDEIKLLHRKIVRLWETRAQQIQRLNKEIKSATFDSPEADPRQPSNHFDDGRLTLRGEEICYRLFDQGLSPMAVAHLMELQLTSARIRQRRWADMGGKKRPTVNFEALPQRKYYRRYDD